MTGPVTTEALVAALTREPIELADGVTPEEVMRLALDGIDIAYRAHGDCARVSLLAVQADWIMQHLARTEAWAKDEQAKRHAAEDKLVEARSRAALAEAAHQQVTAERDEARKEASDLQNDWADEVAASRQETERAEAAEASLATATSELARLRAEGEAKDRALKDLRTDAAELGARLGNASQYDDRRVLRDLCWEAGNFLARRVIRTALARAATAREGA